MAKSTTNLQYLNHLVQKSLKSPKVLVRLIDLNNQTINDALAWQMPALALCVAQRWNIVADYSFDGFLDGSTQEFNFDIGLQAWGFKYHLKQFNCTKHLEFPSESQLVPHRSLTKSSVRHFNLLDEEIEALRLM